jgi:hypothetical protein
VEFFMFQYSLFNNCLRLNYRTVTWDVILKSEECIDRMKYMHDK